MHTRKTIKWRRGISLVEVITASGILLSSISALALLGQVQSRMWVRAGANMEVKQALAQAVGRMESSIQSAMRVDTTRSSQNTLTVVLPGAYSPSTATLSDGDAISFYLSDTSGNPGRRGSLLWRSVNGVPDRQWTYRGGSATDFGTAGLSFTYPGSGKAVMLTAAGERLAGQQDQKHSFSTTLFLRNNRS